MQPQYGPPPGPVQAPAGNEPPVGKLGVILFNVLAVLATLVGGAIIGIAAADSESAGVTASYIVTGPVGFFWGAGIGALLGRFALKNKPAAGKAAPWGCGCGCGLFLAVGLFVFMVAIFPSL
jgi:peptidoglycan/LPS O-acetylase OafA/YrhL